jgi:Pyruvate/2-oxoacid:ferredoxin oxidoreductase delta subunit
MEILKNIENRQALMRLFDMPPFLEPWFDRFFEDIEIELVLLLKKKPMDREETLQVLSSRHQTIPRDADSDLVTRAFRKGIINRRADDRFEPADFHARFDKWSMFEGWKDIPDDIRDRLNTWELDYYERRHADQIDGILKGQPRDPTLIYPEYILVHEAAALLERARHIYLMPCNCRAMMQQCGQSVYTCLRFENDRGVGWEISVSRAKEIIVQANKRGLMQSGEVGIDENGEINGGICNCCADCCYPHRVSERRNAEKRWPLSRYVARRLKDRCIACGRCAKRCPFQAFVFQKSQHGQTVRSDTIQFEIDRCRGCGVCSTGCPEEAIHMIPLESNRSLVNEILCLDGSPQ